jgi:hypothetical protein
MLPYTSDLLAVTDQEEFRKTHRQKAWDPPPQPKPLAVPVMLYRLFPEDAFGPKFLMMREQPGSRYPATGGPGQFMNGTSGPVPGARPLLPDNGRIIQSGSTRILCIADVRGRLRKDLGGSHLTWLGNLSSLNDLARTANADYILHTGDFGFYDQTSLERIADK